MDGAVDEVDSSAIGGASLRFPVAGQLHSASLQLLDEATFSVELWVKPEGNTSNAHTIVHKGTFSPYWTIVRMANTRQIGFYRTQNNNVEFVTGGTAENDEWTHVVAVSRDSSIEVYVDGLASGSQSVPDYVMSNEMGIDVGRASQGIAAPFLGVIDEVSFYDYNLSGSQVTAHFTAGASEIQ